MLKKPTSPEPLAVLLLLLLADTNAFTTSTPVSSKSSPVSEISKNECSLSEMDDSGTDELFLSVLNKDNSSFASILKEQLSKTVLEAKCQC